MKLKFLLYSFLTHVSIFAQVKDTLPPIEAKVEKAPEQVFTIVEAGPLVPHGERILFNYLQENLRYPELARTNGTEGTVYLHFWVHKAGLVSDITVKRGVADGCTEEAIRLIETMPQWIFGQPNQRATKVSHTIPVRFRLDAPMIQNAFDTVPAAGEVVFLKTVSFKPDTCILRPSSYKDLNDLIYMMKKHVALKIEIQGYCTDFQHVPTQSKFVYSKTMDANSDRSKGYSKAVYDYLIQQGIAANRLNYVGHGELEMIASSQTPEGREANRRVAIMIPLEPIKIVDYVKGANRSNCEHASCQIAAKDSTMAQFPNGAKALFQYLEKHLKYPRFWHRFGLQGTVYLTFIVSKDGSLQQIAVMRGMSGGCSEAAVRVVMGMPKWIPATKNGENVCSRFTLPIQFTLE